MSTEMSHENSHRIILNTKTPRNFSQIVHVELLREEDSTMQWTGVMRTCGRTWPLAGRGRGGRGWGGRVGRKVLPLPHAASFSDVEITLRSLVETTQDVDRVQHLWKKYRYSENGWSWPVSSNMNYEPHSSPISWAVSEGHRLCERKEALDTVRGRQGLAKSQQDVRDVFIRFASFANLGRSTRSGSWMNWGRPRARLPLPGSSRSATDGAICPMFCRWCSGALHRVSRTERSNFSAKDQRRSRVCSRRSRTRQRVPWTRHSREVSRRASIIDSVQNWKKTILHVNHKIAHSRKTSFGRNGQ